MGILKQNREQGAGLSRVEREVTVSAFARRRLGVVMVRNGMVENVPAVRIFCSFVFDEIWFVLTCGYRPSSSLSKDTSVWEQRS